MATIPESIDVTVTPQIDPATAPTPHNCIGNRLLYVGGGASGLLILCGFILAIGETFDHKIAILHAVAWPAGAIIVACLSALGYSTGKLFEGVVPAGFQAAAKVLAQSAAVLPPGSVTVTPTAAAPAAPVQVTVTQPESKI